MAATQANRIASVTTSLGEDVLLLYRMSGSEHLSQLFSYELELLSEKNTIDLNALLGQSMTVKLALADGGHRCFNGLVTRIGQYGMWGNYYSYRATLQPKPWLLTRRSNCRIVQHQAVPDIVKTLLAEHGYSDVTLKLSGQYGQREYCVQYRETDFNFISRLLEEEGIYYYFKHAENTHTLVLCDAIAAHDKVSGNGKIAYFPLGNNNQRKEENIYEWLVAQEIQSEVYQLTDYDFEAPKSDLLAKSKAMGSQGDPNKEMFDYPGEYTKADEGAQLAKVRMEELHVQAEQITAVGNTRHLATGQKFTLTDYPRNDQNRDYLVLSSHFQIQNSGYESQGIVGDNEHFQCTYHVINAEINYRPPRHTPVPIVQGVQTAVVVGKQGDEITTDKYGRIKVQFHWDRLGKKDENSSCWVRVAQIWAGKNWGAMHIPRVGQEVIVDFLEGNPDCPIVTGRVYNADQMPPYELDANKTQSGIKSRSTKEGSAENFNEIRFEDKKGSEELYVHAEKDFTRVVENNDKQKVGFDKKSPGDQTVDIYNNRTVTIDQGNDALTVKTGNRTTEIKQGNEALTVAMGNRTASIKQGNDQLEVSMGNRTVKVNLGKIAEEAMQGIELKVGQSSIKIDQMGVTIKGMMVSIEGQIKTDIKGTMTTVGGDAMLTVKGGVVMIN